MKYKFLLLIALLVQVGCVTHDELVGVSSQEVYQSPGWQANTVTTLAFDLREDGKIDFAWPEDVPQALRDKLETRATYLQDNWDGE